MTGVNGVEAVVMSAWVLVCLQMLRLFVGHYKAWIRMRTWDLYAQAPDRVDPPEE